MPTEKVPRRKRRFHIGDVLSIAGDRLVSRDGFTGLQRALSYMAGEDIYVHQVSRVIDEARPVILARYPLLAEVIAPDDINESTVGGWLKKQAALYGEFLTLPRMTIDQHERIEPLSEAVEKKHPSNVDMVRASDRGGGRPRGNDRSRRSAFARAKFGAHDLK